MTAIKSHKDLQVWKRSVSLVREVYKCSALFPIEEKYGLTTQLRRSSFSIPSNIAEGAARKSPKEFIQFLYIALGSLAELETQLFIGDELYSVSNFHELELEIDAIRRMLIGLIKYLVKNK